MALFYAAAHQSFKSVSEHYTRAILVRIGAVENNADTTDLTLKRLWWSLNVDKYTVLKYIT